MAKTKDASVEVEEPTETEQAEAQDAASGSPETEAEPEVRAEEFTRGTDKPKWRSPLPVEVEDELTKPLNPDRVRRRQGRGGSKFEYLAGHDVKRRANELFGFANWSTSVTELRCEAEVEIESRSSGGGGGGYDGEGDAPAQVRVGWHVAYMAIVKVKVRTEEGDWVEYEDVGYGDGNEYGPAALATARELAMKESVTDALKRAFTCLGDQFGLILYAKGDEKARIERDARTETATTRERADVRVEAAGPKPPGNWTEALSRFDSLFAQTIDRKAGGRGDADEWLAELVSSKYNIESVAALKAGERRELFIAFCSTLMLLEGQGEVALMPNLRGRVQQAFKEKTTFDLNGPPWNLGGEDDRPTREEFLAPKPEEIEPIIGADGKEITL